MKSLNKYYWFLFITAVFLIDSGLGNFYLVLYPNITTQEELNKAIQVYTCCKGLSAAMIYFYIAFRSKEPMKDVIDKVYGVLCGVISVYSSVKFLFFAQETSQLYYWALYGLFTLILLYFRIVKR